MHINFKNDEFVNKIFFFFSCTLISFLYYILNIYQLMIFMLDLIGVQKLYHAVEFLDEIIISQIHSPINYVDEFRTGNSIE